MARIDRKVRMWLRNQLEETGLFDRAFVSVSGWGYVRKETNGQPLDQAGLDRLRQAIAGAGLVIQTIRNGDDVCRIEFNVPVHVNGLTGAEAVLAMFEGECPACRLPALEIVQVSGTELFHRDHPFTGDHEKVVWPDKRGEDGCVEFRCKACGQPNSAHAGNGDWAGSC